MDEDSNLFFCAAKLYQSIAEFLEASKKAKVCIRSSLCYLNYSKILFGNFFRNFDDNLQGKKQLQVLEEAGKNFQKALETDPFQTDFVISQAMGDQRNKLEPILRLAVYCPALQVIENPLKSHLQRK